MTNDGPRGEGAEAQTGKEFRPNDSKYNSEALDHLKENHRVNHGCSDSAVVEMNSCPCNKVRRVTCCSCERTIGALLTPGGETCEHADEIWRQKNKEQHDEAREALYRDEEKIASTGWHTSWRPDESDGDDEPPCRLARSDGEHLLYAGKLHWFQGEPESGKTFAALLPLVEVLRRGETGLFIDFEDSGTAVRNRLSAMGANLEKFVYVRPTEPLKDKATLDVERLMAVFAPTIVVIDGVAEAMALHGLDPIRSLDTAAFVHDVISKFRARGVTIICVDHVARGEAGKGRYAYGSQHKLAAVDGASYRFEVLQEFSREQGGAAQIYVAKDRPGFVRSFAEDKQRAGVLRINPAGRGINVTIEPPMTVADGDGLNYTQRRILDVLSGADDGLTYRQIGDELARDGKGKPLKRTTIQSGVTTLIKEGFADGVSTDGRGGEESRFWRTEK